MGARAAPPAPGATPDVTARLAQVSEWAALGTGIPPPPPTPPPTPPTHPPTRQLALPHALTLSCSHARRLLPGPCPACRRPWVPRAATPSPPPTSPAPRHVWCAACPHHLHVYLAWRGRCIADSAPGPILRPNFHPPPRPRRRPALPPPPRARPAWPPLWAPCRRLRRCPPRALRRCVQPHGCPEALPCCPRLQPCVLPCASSTPSARGPLYHPPPPLPHPPCAGRRLLAPRARRRGRRPGALAARLLPLHLRPAPARHGYCTACTPCWHALLNRAARGPCLLQAGRGAWDKEVR